jgi:hypothetical protein
MCAVIVGAGTTVVTTLFPQGGVVSVNFGFKSNVNRLWQLGSWTPFDTYVQKQKDLSITAYGRKPDGTGGSQVFDLTPSESCDDTTSVEVTVNPGACGVNISPFTGEFFPSSFSYSKENFGWGRENWSFTSKLEIDNYQGTIYLLRGIATGNYLVGAGIMDVADMGVVINDAASRDSQGNYIEGISASVQSGFPGLGDYATQRDVVVQSIGGSEGRDDGNKGQASVSIPVNPVYL